VAGDGRRRDRDLRGAEERPLRFWLASPGTPCCASGCQCAVERSRGPGLCFCVMTALLSARTPLCPPSRASTCRGGVRVPWGEGMGSGTVGVGNERLVAEEARGVMRLPIRRGWSTRFSAARTCGLGVREP